MKGGFGLASFRKDGLVVSAAAVVNSLGDIVDEDGTVLAGARLEGGGWAASHDPFRQFHRLSDETRGTNTTLVVIATNAPLSKLEANRLAQRGHDGMAVAIRPAHTSFDGDTVFALATASVGPRQFDNIANIAVVMVAEAIRSAVRHASSAGTWPGLADWSPQQNA
jgi:L-aminopeptidase/D-esterase-like protein